MANRVSTFILVVGGFLLGLFVLSIIAGDVQLGLFFGGLLLLAVGGILQIRFPGEKPPESGRFRMMKRKKPAAAAPKPAPAAAQPDEKKQSSGGHGKRQGKKSH